jgi:sugar phosphate permease
VPGRSGFLGRWIVATAFVTFGLAVGIPYYNQAFFYDYFQTSFHWRLNEITLGFPIAAILTIWVGPLLVPLFSPRKLIVVGSGLTALAFFGFSMMRGSLAFYYLLYFLYTVGYILSGPIPHQILVSYWFRRKRGRAMGILYVGVGLFGGVAPFFIRPITAHYGFRMALMALGLSLLLVWPLAIFFLRDRPSEVGQNPDGLDTTPAENRVPPLSYRSLLRSGPFWLLTLGSICSIGSIGSINLHMKFVFRDEGYTNQKVLDGTWATATTLILWSSIAGRLGVGYLADYFSKKLVMTTTYFAVAGTILLLLWVSPAREYSLYIFALVFGFSMGADYFLIPLMAAEQFGVNTLARAMALILPLNTIGQTWCPELVSILRQHYPSYVAPMEFVLGVSLAGAVAIAFMPGRSEHADRTGLPQTFLSAEKSISST